MTEPTPLALAFVVFLATGFDCRYGWNSCWLMGTLRDLTIPPVDFYPMLLDAPSRLLSFPCDEWTLIDSLIRGCGML